MTTVQIMKEIHMTRYSNYTKVVKGIHKPVVRGSVYMYKILKGVS